MGSSSMVLAEGSSSTPSENSTMSQSAPELKWRQDVQDAKNARTGFLVAGGVTGVAGIGLILAGNIKASSAGDVDGCSRDGVFNVTCNTQAQVDEAQGRIDDGKGLMIVGLVAALVGGAFLWGGSSQTSKIDDLERKGRQQGFKLTLNQTRSKGLRLALAKSF